MYSFGTGAAYSNKVYITAGKRVTLSAASYNDSMFTTKIHLVNANSTYVLTVPATPYGGMDWGYYTVPTSGYYSVKAECTDGSLERCKAVGTASYTSQ